MVTIETIANVLANWKELLQFEQYSPKNLKLGLTTLLRCFQTLIESANTI